MLITIASVVLTGCMGNAGATKVNEDPRVETVADSMANNSQNQSQHLLFHETN